MPKFKKVWDKKHVKKYSIPPVQDPEKVKCYVEKTHALFIERLKIGPPLS